MVVGVRGGREENESGLFSPLPAKWRGSEAQAAVSALAVWRLAQRGLVLVPLYATALIVR